MMVEFIQRSVSSWDCASAVISGDRVVNERKKTTAGLKMQPPLVLVLCGLLSATLAVPVPLAQMSGSDSYEGMGYSPMYQMPIPQPIPVPVPYDPMGTALLGYGNGLGGYGYGGGFNGYTGYNGYNGYTGYNGGMGGYGGFLPYGLRAPQQMRRPYRIRARRALKEPNGTQQMSNIKKQLSQQS
ncbi:glycine-rich protein-like isoform X2 [Polypterus senegalus]|uniref:glycine-rich protein-like isoform X2 n=1 Tax=Polypterus senegalus TaxID=55291 RepID=UPI0019668F61|nr:glycine-rich protein-like isoform X2 [Polypterus senegalus]